MSVLQLAMWSVGIAFYITVFLVLGYVGITKLIDEKNKTDVIVGMVCMSISLSMIIFADEYDPDENLNNIFMLRASGYRLETDKEYKNRIENRVRDLIRLRQNWEERQKYYINGGYNKQIEELNKVLLKNEKQE